MKNSTFYDYQKSINKVIEYIEQNIEKSLELNTLSKVSGFSQFHFHRIFFDLTGETLNNYIRRIRIEKSTIKLVNSDESITTIALEVGYKTPSSYNKSFKQYYGITPKEYRQNYQEKTVFSSKDFVLKKRLISNITVLYVEDEEELRTTYNEILSMLVGRVYIAKDGLEAIKIYKEKQSEIDLVMSDIRMPNLDGIEFSTMLREISLQIPIILATAFSDTNYLLKAIKLGVNDYVLKPISIENLMDSMYKVMLPVIQKRRLQDSENLIDDNLYTKQILEIVSEKYNNKLSNISSLIQNINDKTFTEKITDDISYLSQNCNFLFDILQVDNDVSEFELTSVISSVMTLLSIETSISSHIKVKSFKSTFSKIILCISKLFKDNNIIPIVKIKQQKDMVIITFESICDVSDNFLLNLAKKNVEYIDGAILLENNNVIINMPKEL